MDRRRMMCGADCFGDGRPHVGSAIVRVEVFNTGHASQKNVFFLDKPIEYLVRFGGDCEFPGVESENFSESNLRLRGTPVRAGIRV